MVRSICSICPPRWRSPPARGDGPAYRAAFARTSRFSPRTGGWSVAVLCCCERNDVLPPHGGMVRHRPYRRPQGGRSPPARGDGPQLCAHTPSSSLFSPRTGGWSALFNSRITGLMVLPPHGGMVRSSSTSSPPTRSSPPARGDGPHSVLAEITTVLFSPRTGGWSAGRERRGSRHPVLPPHGGMVRHKRENAKQSGCSPPARGDGPSDNATPPELWMFSPRTGGWSVCVVVGMVQNYVLPPHGGMVRRRTGRPDRLKRSPPARGDGPGRGHGDGAAAYHSAPVGASSIVLSYVPPDTPLPATSRAA